MKKLCIHCWLIILLICTNALAQPLDKIAAIVNDGVITENELMTQVNLVQKQMQHQNAGQVPSLNVLKQQVLQHMIEVEMQLQLAKQAKVVVDSSDIDTGITKIASENHLNLTQLRKIVEAQGVSWAQYRDNIKKEMTIARVQQQAIGHNVIITDQQVKDYLRQHPQAGKTNPNNAEFHVKDILIALPENPTSTQLQAAQNKANTILQNLQHGADFDKMAVADSSIQTGDLGFRKLVTLPPVFANKITNMSVGSVAGPLRTTNGLHIIKLVETHGIVAPQHITVTKVRHILLKVDAANTPESVKEKMKRIRIRIQQGADFAKLAEQNSQDPASSGKGGDLGWVYATDLMPSFAEAMDKLQPGQVSEPVQTSFGWHLIKVEGRKQIDDSKDFQQQQVKQLLYQQKFSEQLHSWLQTLRSRAYIKIMAQD